MRTGGNDPLMGSNHLTVVRWLLAGAVAIGHVFLLTEGFEPLRIHEWTASYMAVNGFFVLSGLLIAKSLHMRRDIKAYAMSRALRIYPALIVILLAFVLVFAPLYSSSGNLFSAENWSYLARVLVLGDPEAAPAAIFESNRDTAFNGVLWTIRFELIAYIAAGIAFLVGALNGLWRTVALFVLVQGAYIAAPFIVDADAIPAGIMSLLRLSSAFLLGMVLWHWQGARRPPWWSVAGLVGLFALFGGGLFGELLATLALTSLVLRIGLPARSSPRLSAMPDFSYGIYIWHYPIMQAVLVSQPGLGPAGLAVISFPLFLIASGVSWYIVEKPALGLKQWRLKRRAQQLYAK